jgi:flagellar hook assembly protein FlgD
MDDYGFVEFYTEGSVNLRIEIYDLLGRKVKDVFNGLTSAGFQGVSFQTNNLPNGNYTLVISHNSQKIVKQITIMK